MRGVEMEAAGVMSGSGAGSSGKTVGLTTASLPGVGDCPIQGEWGQDCRFTKIGSVL